MTRPPPPQPRLIDPATATDADWPEADADARAYATAFVREGAPALIANLRTTVQALVSGGRVFPVTVNAGDYGNAYVCAPHTAYCLYAKAELALENLGATTLPLALTADVTGAILKAARFNDVVHLDNWMLSTNLHGGWPGEDLPAITALLCDRFPNHFLAIRSINVWSDPELSHAAAQAGWRLLPSRQIWVMDDVDTDWASRRDSRQDQTLLDRSGYRIEPVNALEPGEAERIADLYAQLYLGKYSRLNPGFTPRFIAMTHAAGVLTYRGVRGADGRLDAVIGSLVRGGVLTTPVLGYDFARPREAGLYRIASTLVSHLARERGARVNASAGAGKFKRTRGARPVIEYSAYYARHLSRPRRAVLAGLETGLNRAVVPMMRRLGL